MAGIRANGVVLNVRRLSPRARESGEPPAVVFLHGAIIDSLASFYFTLGPAFAAAGFDAVMYDQRGHGRSERPASGYAIQDFTADLDALLDALGLVRPVHLVGNSFGGTVALDYAVLRPGRTASVVVIESAPATPQWAATMHTTLHQGPENVTEEEALDWFVDQYGAASSTRRLDPRDPRLVRLVRGAGRLMAATTIARDLPGSRMLTDEQLASVRCPVLLLNGGEGLVAAESARLASLLPRARLAELPGQKHSVLVEAPREVCRLALDWVAAHAHPAAAGGTAR